MAKTIVKQVDSYIYRITDNGPLYLMMKRNIGKHYSHLWQGVAGKIEKGETAWQAVIRELKEETGKLPQRIFVADHIASFYNAKEDIVQMVPIFGIEVKGEDVILSDEHCDFQWVKYEEALNLLTWKGQKEGLKTVHDDVVNNDERSKWSEIKFG